MDDVEFISWDELVDEHRDQLKLFGGQDGFIDEGVVRSAWSRPQFTLQYTQDADLADLAADYVFGLATTQGFMDGNKRIALAAGTIFIRRNGYRLIISDDVLWIVVLAVARDELDRDGLAEILREHMVELE